MLAYMAVKALDGLPELVEELGGSSARLIESTGISERCYATAMD